MMENTAKRNYIQKLIDNLKVIDENKFEKLSGYIAEHFSNCYFNKRGHNVNGTPVGHTLDAFTDDLNVAMEASTEKNYFKEFLKSNTGEKSKVLHDIEHALNKSENLTHLFLFSNQEAGPTETTNLSVFCGRYEKDYNITISWFDGRKIAEYILENMLMDNVIIEKITPYLPELENIRYQYINDVEIPKLPENYVQYELEEVDRAVKILKSRGCLYIYGISGIGKSLLSIEIALKIKKNYDAVYYIDATKIEKASQLESVEWSGMAGKINLLGSIKRPRTLVILDDLKHEFDSVVTLLRENLAPLSNIIITSQTKIKAEDICFRLNFPSDERGTQLLEYKHGEKCPNEIKQTIKRKTNFHPILLNIINHMVQDGNEWESICEELEHASDFETDSGESVNKRLLSHYRPLLEKEFGAINWLNTQYINKELLRSIIGISGMDKLKRRDLFYDTSGCNIKIHDIIFACLKTIYGDTEKYRENFLKFFSARYLKKEAQYYQALHLHREKILELLRERPEPGLELYLYLDIWSRDDYKMIKNISYENFFEPEYRYEEEDLVKLYSLIQLFECDYKCYREEWEKKAAYAREYIEKFEYLLKLEKIPDTFLEYTRHHLGKLLEFLHEEDAKNIFEEIIKKNPAMYESKLQLARIYKRKRNVSGEEALLKNILDDYIAEETASENKIAATIVLASYDAIKGTGNQKLIQKYFVEEFDYFYDALYRTVSVRFDLPYRVLANVAKVYSYEHPKLYEKLMEMMPFPSKDTIPRQYAFAIAEAYKEYGKSLIWDTENEGNKGEAKVYFEQAENFYKKSDGKKPYERIRHAENFIKLGKYEEAIELIEDEQLFIDTSDYPFREQRYAEALLGLKHYKPALDHINSGIGELKKEKFFAAFYQLKGDIFYGMDAENDEWKKWYEAAIAKADSDKYKSQLKEKMSSYANAFTLVVRP